MTFPTIPTVAAGRVLTAVSTASGGTSRATANLSGLTKNSGDLLIAIAVGYQTTAGNGAAWSAWTTGWTEFMDYGGTGSLCLGAAYKWSTGSETGAVDVTQAATVTGQFVSILLSIPGAHATTPPEGGGFSTGTTVAPNAGLNPAGWDVEDSLWIAVGSGGETSTSGSFTGVAGAPTNYSNLAATAISQDVVGGVNAAVAFRQLAAASVAGVQWTAVDLSNARNSSSVIAVRPVPDAPQAEMLCGIPI